MSYISTARVNDEVYVWERGEDGKREIKTFATPYYFFTEHADGEYISLFGSKLKRHDFDTAQEMNEARRECEGKRIRTYESDIPPELKILSEYYYNKPAPSLKFTFLDIEVDYNRELGFSSVHNPYAEINSVALHHYWCDRTVLLVIPPSEYGEFDVDRFYKEMNDIENLPATLKKKDIIVCSTEYELLLNLLIEIEDSDLLSGWNSDFFDIPYIGKRIEIVLGEKYFAKLSFPMAGKPRWRTVEKFNVQNETLEVQGRMTLDYLDLFKKYEVAERPSYKLESIANEVLPELPKLEYEGSLADLYRKDFAYFARYNVRDTEILEGFERKLGYIALASEMYHISCGMSKHVGGTLKLAELAINNYCIHELNLRVPDNEERQDSAGIQGALVLEPKVGMHEWIGSMDINSLYPSSIRSINISPETLIGQFTSHGVATEEIKKESFVNLVLEYDDGRQEQRTAQEWREFLKERKWTVSGYGTVFTQQKQGVIPSILEEWYATRKKYKKLMNEARKEAQSIVEKYK